MSVANSQPTTARGARWKNPVRREAVSTRRATRKRGDALLERFEENVRLLNAAHHEVRLASAGGATLSPGGAWLVDNYYLVQEQVRMARLHLPRKYSQELPRSTDWAGEGLPRVYELALQWIARTDGRLDLEKLFEFVGEYQNDEPLGMGELWAIPIMLRLALVENLCRAASQVARRLPEAEATPAPHDDPRAIENIVSSLRALAGLEWTEFIEGLSVVERILREDPAGVYPRMGFASRDHYRHVVETLARHVGIPEDEVARVAVRLAREAKEQIANLPEIRQVGNLSHDTGKMPVAPASPSYELAERHVGYYLVDRGRALLEIRIGYRRSWHDALRHAAGSASLTCYLGAIAGVWLLIVGGIAAEAVRLGALREAGLTGSLLLAALLAGAAGQCAVTVVNWLATLLVRPRPMMRMDFSTGIPAECLTFVAIPTMLGSELAVRSLLEQFEVRFLANPDANLRFALVTDFPDANQETLPDDQRLVELACQGVRRLNQRYARHGASIFYLFHRRRKWNPQEGVWMGEERKRGKLASLNRMLSTGDARDFSITVGHLEPLRRVRYVITLDTDTRLPRDAARQLVGCMAHPLNRPRIDPATRIVTDGFGVLQPRVTSTFSEASPSLFGRLFGGDAGIDLYTRQTSNVYQDLFDEGSFIGKGIYDVRAFEAALAGRFPPNRVLSHDLIEGCFARSGFVNDVELFEQFPSRLLADMSRRHRWIRGDWQIAAWLGRSTPAVGATGILPVSREADCQSAESQGRIGNLPHGNPLSPLSRWKIFDNLWRSLVPVCLLGFLVTGWLLAPSLAAYWTLAALAITLGPPLAGWLPCVLRKPQDSPWRLHVSDQVRSCCDLVLRELIGWCILPYVVHCHLDAILRTLYRLHVSRRKLLEWTISGEAEVRSEQTCRGHYHFMGACTLAGAAGLVSLPMYVPDVLVFAVPFLLGWLAGPMIAWRISQPRRPQTSPLGVEEAAAMRRWARRTWHYFDTFATEAEHWLPPDNVRTPQRKIASRTSPTNIGMGLLADLAAHDFGYLPAAELLRRTDRTLRTMTQLERHRGHFCNWYDTRTLEPLEPRYVSSVDSGNLWASLIVLRAGLEELPDQTLVSPRLLDGLQDAVETIAAMPDAEQIGIALLRLRAATAGSLPGGARTASAILARIQRLAAKAVVDDPVLQEWIAALVRQCAASRNELGRLAFWLTADGLTAATSAEARKAVTPLLARLDALDRRCTLRELPEAAEEVRELITGVLRSIAETNGADHGLRAGLLTLADAAGRSAGAARDLLRQIVAQAELCRRLSIMDFRPLYHRQRQLLTIGFNLSQQRHDAGQYDLLASESRLTSFLAVGFGQIAQSHWFALGRQLTLTDAGPVLLSWSGSMFEYLMPNLFLPTYAGTLLDAACRTAVRRQIIYGRQQGVPWGISESCFHETDAEGAYQYRAFGVPGLGLQRGLARQSVIAPYASALAAMIAPGEACGNLQRIERLGGLGPYGFHDALDFTPARRPASGEPCQCEVVMAHHSGMTLAALANVLLDRPMQRRFMKEPCCRAHDLLLQERAPQTIRPMDPEALDTGPSRDDASPEKSPVRRGFWGERP
jgi:hypothetical protein